MQSVIWLLFQFFLLSFSLFVLICYFFIVIFILSIFFLLSFSPPLAVTPLLHYVSFTCYSSLTAPLLLQFPLPSCRLKSKNATPPVDESALWDPPLELGVATKGAVDAPDQNITREPKEQLLDFQPLLNLPAQLKDLKVIVSHINSPSSFYVQFTQFNSLHERSAAKPSLKNPLNKPNVGTGKSCTW